MNHGFSLTQEQDLPGLAVNYQAWLHEASGARHYHLASSDENNAFMVAFPTLPEDSSGVAHILEHTALCGSERYPVRDPFFMMLRRSLNTYMNAFTSSDSTAYPFATCNRKDFDNLLGVYLDAAFAPRLDPLDFAQEGWRYDFDAGGALEYHGVVYNEMKGAMCSPHARLWQHIHTALFPDTVYRHNSGGEPADIPALTHDGLVAFHRRHYNAANAVFMTYGSFPAAAHQARFAGYLASAATNEPCESRPQAPFTRASSHVFDYQWDSADEPATHVVWAWVCGDAANIDDVLDLQLLSSLLLDNSASPLRRLLEQTTLASAPSELCGVDDSARQLVFIAGVEGSDARHADALGRELDQLLTRVAADGMEGAVIEAALDRLELAQRDLGGGTYPFGLELMGRLLPAAMYRAEPLPLLDAGPALAALRARAAAPGFVSALVRRLLLDNAHATRIVMRPDPAYAAGEQAAEHARLAAAGTALSDERRAAIRAQSEALAERQEQEDDADLLPRVTLADVPAARDLVQPTRRDGNPARPVSEYECGTNGVFRARVAYRLPSLGAAEIAALPLFCEYLTEFGQGEQDYLAVQQQRAAIGEFGVHALARPLPAADDAHMAAWLIVGAKGLAQRRDDLIENLAGIVPATRFDETARLDDLLTQSRLEAEQALTDRGHQVAVLSAAAGINPSARLDETWDGPSSVRLLQTLCRRSPGECAALFETFESIRAKLLAMPRRVALIADGDTLAGAADACRAITAGAADARDTWTPSFDAADEVRGWITESQVSFCACAWPAPAETDRLAPALAVLGHYLQDGFLHREIRERGGAYGSGARYDADSRTFRMFSYRDPRLAETFADFERALAWFAGHADARLLEEAILGVVRALDQPRSPAGEAERAFMAELCGRDSATLAAFRAAALAVTQADLEAAAARWLEPANARRAALAGPGASAALEALGLVSGRLS